jgi:hypothetical protein
MFRVVANFCRAQQGANRPRAAARGIPKADENVPARFHRLLEL